MQTYQNYINGEWKNASRGEVLTSINPADETEIASFQSSEAEDLEEAVDAAQNARKKWKSLTGAERGQFLYKVADIIEKKAEEIGNVATQEMGKTLAETTGEANRAVAILRYYAGEGMRSEGDVIPPTDPEALMFTKRVPLGVVGVITPWNFPIAIPIWKIAPALIYGNTVVLKPASETAVTAAKIVECFEEAGFPEGVINLITGKGAVIGEGLSTNPGINGITFTGSNSVGKGIGAKALDRGAKYQLEMGGKNPVIVMKDADLEQAAEATIAGAYKSTGQKCTATSRVIVEEEIFEEFQNLLVDKVKEITVGNSLEEDVWMGPCASEAQLKNTLKYLEIGREEGAKLLIGGEQLHEGNGFYVKPAIFTDVSSSMRIAQEEIFGPVIAMIKANGVEEALNIANDVEYGLSASIFTKNISNMLNFIDDMDAGLVRVNAESAGVELQAPFGGMKQSSSHSREQGQAAKEFFTSIKTVFVKP